ncbi:hypothetical protein QL285_032540 [Trifolium repens]|nr:hypothetical protein QL285_032540 [Trifolium repens]
MRSHSAPPRVCSYVVFPFLPHVSFSSFPVVFLFLHSFVALFLCFISVCSVFDGSWCGSSVVLSALALEFVGGDTDGVFPGMVGFIFLPQTVVQ